MSNSEPFYAPSPDMFGHADAYRLFTGYAAELEKAGLADRFPPEAEVRHIAVELLAERHSIDTVEEEPSLISEAIGEAHVILQERRQ